MNEELLKQKRAEILSDFINQIKISIEKNKITGEQSKKIYIYNRLADFTYYSEVSIRKFVTGALPRDLVSFVQGMIQYAKLVKIPESRIQEFTDDYVSAANSLIIESDYKVKTKNNLIPQDLTAIIRARKLTEYLDKFLLKDINISYIYGYRLSGKTKSVTAYINDITNQNKYENIIWIDIKEIENQIKQIIDTILMFIIDDKNHFVNSSPAYMPS